MTARAFVDSNVLVYAYDTADRTKQDQALSFLASQEPASLVISSQVLSEFYVVVTRKIAEPLSEAEAGDVVRGLANLRVVSLTGDTVVRALDLRARWQTSYWDALILAAAESADCAQIVSEDLATGSTIAGIEIRNPFGLA